MTEAPYTVTRHGTHEELLQLGPWPLIFPAKSKKNAWRMAVKDYVNLKFPGNVTISKLVGPAQYRVTDKFPNDDPDRHQKMIKAYTGS